MTKYLWIALILCSCSANTHLKLAESHIRKAKLKGAVIHYDTVYKEVILFGTTTDTVFVMNGVERLLYDTLTIETTRWKTKTKIDTVTKKVYQQVECKPDTVKVPVIVKESLNTEKPGFKKYGVGALFGVLFVFFLLWVVRK